MLQTVRVRLRKATRLYTFLVRDLELHTGEACVVHSDRGLELGFVVQPPEECPEERADQYPMTVVRKATASDEKTYHQIIEEEARAKALCVGKIVQRRLPMRLVNVEYTLDRHKVIFYFTADERVDFRELVRDLAHELKTRIELRHIQVRDKSKLVGGLAACGRELCCASWLKDFMPISMKMAKRQNLSLNPTKISGQCGRLMCCLGYENCNYPDKKKKSAEARDAGEMRDDIAIAEEALPEEEEAVTVSPGETVYEIDLETGEEHAHEMDLPEAGQQPDGDQKPRRRRPRRRRRKNRAAEGEGGSAS